MINLFGENCKTKYNPANNNGLIYSDSEWMITYENIRKSGILPGKAMSSTAINTALRQSTFAYYVLLNAFKSYLSTKLPDSTLLYFFNTQETPSNAIDKIVNWVNAVNNIVDNSIDESIAGAEIPISSFARNYAAKGGIDSALTHYENYVATVKDNITGERDELLKINKVQNYSESGKISTAFKNIETEINRIKQWMYK